MKDHFRSFSLSIVIVCIGLLLLTACNHNPDKPDVSNVHVKDVHIERFENAFFSIDSNNIVSGLHLLAQKYPWFTYDFVGNILGAGAPSDTSRIVFDASRQFLVSYLPVYDSLRQKYTRLDWLEKELTTSFRYTKYYFPHYNLPEKVVTYIGPFDGPGIALTNYALAIGLQSYAGKNFSFYLSSKGQELYPQYISRRFEPEYITANCIISIAQDIIPDSSEGRPLIEQMIIKGKYLWLQTRLLPDAPDTIRSGFTAAHLKWCTSHEGDIWNYFLQNTDLYTLDPDIIKNFIGDSPKTNGMPDAAPGNVGAWVGWQIVKKYLAANNVNPETLMHTSAKTIFEESKYKPH